MTPEQAVETLKTLQGKLDPEVFHVKADEVLCDLISALGHPEVVAEWRKVHRWYA